MKKDELQRSEWMAVAGGLIMALGLFLTWYHLKNGNVSIGDETGPADLSGWQVHTIIRWLLLAAAAAPFILAWIVVRGHALSWPRGEVTAIVGLTAFVLIAFNGIVSKPQNGLEISLSFGYWLALLASIGIFISGGFRAVESGGGAQRKPPATF